MFIAIFESPIGIAMEFAGGNTAHMNKRPADFFGAILSPRNITNFGGEFGDVFVIFEVCPKFSLGAGLDF